MIPSSSAVLVVDDDAVHRSRLGRAFETRGWLVTDASDGRTALEAARSASFDLAIVDLRMPGIGGLEVVRELHQIDPSICIILLTGFGTVGTAVTATKSGAAYCLNKPADADQILAVYKHLVDGADPEPGDTVPSLARVEWEHIQRVLRECDGNVAQAARMLGMYRKSLQRKLQKNPPPA